MGSEERASHELLQAQAHIWNHIFSFINSMSLKCAVQLDIPDVIQKHGQPMTLSELVSTLPISPKKAHFIQRLMRILVHFGFFARESLSGGGEQGYSLTDASALLLKDNPMSARPFLLAMLNPILTDPWQSLTTWFQNDNPTPFHMVHGMTFWDYGKQDPTLAHFFNDAMASDARLISSLMIDDYKGVFQGVDSLVDVAGGTGTVGKSVVEAFPHMKCTVLDLPHIVADLKGSKSLEYVAEDMFEAVPAGDAIFLKWTLHDWTDEECVRILERSANALSGEDAGSLTRDNSQSIEPYGESSSLGVSAHTQASGYGQHSLPPTNSWGQS
ncbi:probable O-methyltransferase 3 [Prunus avium]|uniref:Probable O-methyltransferase 3 n=1 Tax=Prunus avium TaxID=42229 RepID=A0A6P5RHQ7_PRUAV|nr:probable O-methyltransferase 3 [Prunus avium]